MSDAPSSVPRRERPTLSDIDLRVPSLVPPSSGPELDALARVDEVGRAHAASWQQWKGEEAERFLQAEHERRIARMKVTGALVCSAIAALAAVLSAIAAILTALK